MWRLWTTFWQLSKTERSGYVLLLALMAAYMGLSWWAPASSGPDFTPLLAPAVPPADSVVAVAVPGSAVALSPFDINTIDAEGLRSLGLGERSIQGLLRFRSKGGKVRNAADFDKLFSLTSAEKDRLRPWLRFSDKPHADSSFQSTPSFEKQERKSRLFEPVDLNTADSVALLEVPGVGPAFAGRIVRYRERLGGFVQLEQLTEVFGVDSGRFAALAPLLKVERKALRKIDPAAAPEEALAAHPYVGRVLARRWVAFREQRNGNFGCKDLAVLHGLDAARLEKLRPYLACEGLQQAD